MDRDTLELGIPDDEAATAPRQKYRTGEGQRVWPGRAAIALLALAWGALASKKLAPEGAKAEGVEAQPQSPLQEPDAPARPRESELVRHIPEMAPTGAPPQDEDGPEPLPDNVILFPGGAPAPFALSPQRWHAKRAPAIEAGEDTLFFPEAIELAEFELPKVPVFTSSRSDAAGQSREGGREGGDGKASNSPPSETQTPPVVPGNRAPEATTPLRLPPGWRDESFFILAAVLLTGVVDPDGDPLSILSMRAEGGALIAHAEGEWLFKPEQGFEGEAQITYLVTDGKYAVEQVASVEILPRDFHDIAGTAAEDLLVGTPDRDAIRGFEGRDILYGREGDDVLDGGAGNDVLIGGAGADVIYGGAGNDLVFAGEGNDLVFGGVGNDVLHGEAGDDYLDGGTGADSLFGGSGADILLGGDGDDLLDGGAGGDSISGGDGADTITLAAAAESDGDRYDGGGDCDTLDLSRIAEGAHVDLSAGTVSIGAAQATIVNVENVTAGMGSDVIVADESCNTFTGGAGEDRFVFNTVAAVQNQGRGHDRITDFEPGDRIDFSQIDPEGEGYGDLRMFFAGRAGEIADARGGVFVAFEFDEDDAQEFTILKAKFQLDGEEEEDDDFEIELDGHHDLDETNFVFETEDTA
ncbi:RTX toxin [Thioclava dalianensis]|uniref:RTX toxin n=1 Tax=Thioclava dalianensis TaxID=1185766 RepID=A0A074T8D9_9RHOB|nr:cadherin-like domain-containing protein [Thioclava dalianensis]KEP67974.1 RTX toxin [Thioclava dalianensis]SFN91716.1 Hemolysin-type calcium-binding repeat-containing protein [Thioclava dalianensis]